MNCRPTRPTCLPTRRPICLTCQLIRRPTTFTGSSYGCTNSRANRRVSRRTSRRDSLAAGRSTRPASRRPTTDACDLFAGSLIDLQSCHPIPLADRHIICGTNASGDRRVGRLASWLADLQARSACARLADNRCTRSIKSGSPINLHAALPIDCSGRQTALSVAPPRAAIDVSADSLFGSPTDETNLLVTRRLAGRRPPPTSVGPACHFCSRVESRPERVVPFPP